MPASIDGVRAWIVVERAYTIHRLCDRGSTPVAPPVHLPTCSRRPGLAMGTLAPVTPTQCGVIWLRDEAATLTRMRGPAVAGSTGELAAGEKYSRKVQQPWRPCACLTVPLQPSDLGKDLQRPSCRQFATRGPGFESAKEYRLRVVARHRWARGTRTHDLRIKRGILALVNVPGQSVSVRFSCVNDTGRLSSVPGGFGSIADSVQTRP